jgi:soluble lytic murein transglycosylase-like protein
VLIAAVAAGLLLYFYRPDTLQRGETTASAPSPSAPADLEKLRGPWQEAVNALQENQAAEAVKKLESFDFGSRAVDEYRLYYLANAHQLNGDRKSARVTLARLWRRKPRMIYATDIGFNLSGLYTGVADWQHSAAVLEQIARRNEPPAIEGTARWQAVQSRFAAGDVATMLQQSREIVISNPLAPDAGGAIAVVRALTGVAENAPLPLTPRQRLDRAINLLRDGKADDGLAELDALAPVAGALHDEVQLQRGMALQGLRRYEDSNKALEPLTSGEYKFAIPALRGAARNYRVLAASIDPTVTKVITEKKKQGTIKVKVGKGKKRRTVTKPKIVTVKRTVKLVDLAKKQKKETYERLASERLKDLLLLPDSKALRLETLNTLIGIAAAKKQDAYQQELIREVVEIDPLSDPGLQYFWDKAWGAYTRGDLATAKPAFRFIADTYKNPNVRRQSEYWYARTIDRAGEKGNAVAIYKRLADAPYADLYAIHAAGRGGKLSGNRTNPLEKKGLDWREIADKEMPDELRLAYELTAISDMRDARLEIQKNMSPGNVRFAEALLADLYSSSGNRDLMYRSIRRAYPQLATVEQDSVPAYFLRMYYPTAYHDTIRKEAKKRGLAPELVMALILQESYYNPKARSGVGATGLMQIMPATGKELGKKLHGVFSVTHLEDPETNIELGTYYISTLVRLFGNNDYLAVASYNAGQGNVAKWRRAAPGKPMDEFLESIPFPETRNYVKRVTMLRSSYARIAP